MKSYITDIQRFSLRDGDGIRTTVFFKGCNMKCPWCHNPETISHDPELMFYESKCIGCGKCFEACPTGAHKTEDGKHFIDRALCTNCGKCASVCYAEALTMCGKEMTADEIMAEICQDKEYYKNSGGGVTLSGGEVLCHREFAAALLDACHTEGIHTAIETNLSFAFEMAEPLLSRADLIMCDVKLYDDAAHRMHTGVSNRTILENVTKLDSLGVPVIVRTPLIPGVTDSAENLTAIAKHIKHLKNLRRYELLNFNPLGEGKYRALERANGFESARPFASDVLDGLKSAVEAVGVRVKIV